MTQTKQAPIAASTLRSIDAGGFINTQLDKAATLLDSQHARILELETELLAEKRHQRTRDVAAVRTLGALGFSWNGGEAWQAAPKAVQAAVPTPFTSSIMLDDGGDRPYYCLMTAYLSEAEARAALSLLSAPAQPVPTAEPSDAEIDAAIQAFDWEGWIDPEKAKRAFTREALSRWTAAAHPAEEVPAQAAICVPAELLERIVDSLASYAGNLPHKPADMQAWEQLNDLLTRGAALAATQPAAQGMDSARAFIEWLKAQPEDREPTTIDGALSEFEAHVAAQAKQGGA